jgi:hypothetical protein
MEFIKSERSHVESKCRTVTCVMCFSFSLKFERVRPRTLGRNRIHTEYGSVVTDTDPYRMRFFYTLSQGMAYGTA